MSKFLEAIETVTSWIIGEKHSGNKRRVKKSTRKTTKRKVYRRKK